MWPHLQDGCGLRTAEDVHSVRPRICHVDQAVICVGRHVGQSAIAQPRRGHRGSSAQYVERASVIRDVYQTGRRLHRNVLRRSDGWHGRQKCCPAHYRNRALLWQGQVDQTAVRVDEHLPRCRRQRGCGDDGLALDKGEGRRITQQDHLTRQGMALHRPGLGKGRRQRGQAPRSLDHGHRVSLLDGVGQSSERAALDRRIASQHLDLGEHRRAGEHGHEGGVRMSQVHQAGGRVDLDGPGRADDAYFGEHHGAADDGHGRRGRVADVEIAVGRVGGELGYLAHLDVA